MSQALDEASEQGGPTSSVRERVSEGLRGLLGRVERAGESLAAGAAKGRGRAAEAAEGLRRSVPLRHGLAAGERGNLEAALALLREAVELSPDDAEAVLALWNVALSCQQPEVAAPAMARRIHLEASSDRKDLAVEHWMELVSQVPDQRVDVPTLVRLLPELRSRVAAAHGPEERGEAEGWLRRALRACVAPGAREMTTGLALRIFEQARFLDVGTARRAGKIVLAASDLHETKRQHIETLMEELESARAAPEPADVSEPAAVPERAAAPAPAAVPERAAVPAPAAVPERAAAPAPAAAAQSAPVRAGGRRVIEVIPVELSAHGMIVQESASGRRSRVDLRSVEAIAVARVDGVGAQDAPLIDLVLRRTSPAKERRIVRMCADAFDPSAVLSDAAAGDDPLGGLVGALLERSGAVPLPDPDSVLGTAPRHFESLEDYEQAVLARPTAR